ncbi:MAG TPA: hypothetical protein VF593_00240 [Chthoniobacteraceae bacterium]|jgi:hypothetical protein
MNLRILLFLLILPISLLHGANEIGFIEKFALAPNREVVLGELIPGSEDFYFYHALHFQNTSQAAKLKSTLETWAQRFPDSARRRIIENRAALLSYDANPQATLEFLRQRLSPDLSHEQEARDRKPELPTALPSGLIDRNVFRQRALDQGDSLEAFSDAALEALVREKVALRPGQIRALLARLKRPDLPGLVDLLAQQLALRESRAFGELPIHALLLPEQMDELARRIPALAEQQSFVLARLKKLLPGADADAEYDPAEREAWLDRAWAYVGKLPPAFNTLKAQILFQRLQHDRTRGVYDKARFIEYLKLPRRMPYVNPRYVDQPELARHPVDLNADFGETLRKLPPIGSDEWLVREFLLRLLRDEQSWEPWAVWLRDTYLKPIFAEAKIVNGIGNAEQWASILTPTAFQALKDRVDVDFSAANPLFTAPAEDVNLDLLIKNVPKLIVKVYEVNTLSFFLTQKRQLNTDVNLDGLIANQETTHDFSADPALRSPFRRVPRIFEFPELKGKRGAWVIEFIGGGKSSRSLVRKGQLHLLQQTGPAGEMLQVLDETFQPLKGAAVWLDGRRFVTDEKTGFIVVPFTNQPGRKPIILADAEGSFATLTEFEHRSERYRLDVQFHLEREQLLARRNATLAVRTNLLLGDAHLALELLQEPKITLTTTTLDGVSTVQEIQPVKLEAGRVFTHTVPVPERVASVAVALTGKIENLSAGGSKQDLTASDSFQINGIDKEALVADGQLNRFGNNYVFELLGKNGEPLPDQVLSFRFKNLDFSNEVEVQLSSDAKGRAVLGPLAGIEQVKVSLPNGRERDWTLDRDGATRSDSLHVKAGEVLRVPWVAAGGRLLPEQVSLLERRENTFVKDHFAALSLAEGSLVIKGLSPGDYSLLLREEKKEITVRVTAGAPMSGWLLSANRQLQLRNAPPVQIESVRAEGDALLVQLRNTNPLTRLHLAAARFIPEQRRLSDLGSFQRLEPALGESARRPNLFAAGRAIGDEYRYILERRYSKIFPGNMLPRPGLLLNPWEVRSTDLAAQEMARSESLSRARGDREARQKAAPKDELQQPSMVAMAAFPGSNLDFLAAAAPTLFNLVPDATGLIRIERNALGDRQYLQLYAEDLTSAAWRTVALPEAATQFQDLRLARGLDPAKPFTQKRQVSVLRNGETLTLADLVTSELETYDSLGSIYALFSTLNKDPKLATFSFLLQWPKLTDAEKRAKYSEFACHELHFFLSRKDPAFFAQVVQPYLANKKDRTFMDDYLLGSDLASYLEPWAFARLNVAERSLLGRKIPEQAATTARHLRELWEMLPPDMTRLDQLFETALRARGLGESDELKKSLLEEQKNAPAPSIPGLEGASDAPLSAPAKQMPASRVIAGNRSGGWATDSVSSGERLGEDKKGNRFGSGNEGLEDAGLAFFSAGAGVPAERAKALRAEVRQYFRELGPTKEWAENNYHQLPLAQQNAELVKINAFWRDFAAWDGKAPFLSENVAEASGNFTEIVLALAVLDLPFEAGKHTTRADAGAFTLTAASPLLAFHKQIKPANQQALGSSSQNAPELLVSQNFFRLDDPSQQEGNETSDKYVSEEFLSGVVYGARIVVTNPSSTPRKLELLLQIPRGALPVRGSKATESRRLQLGAYTTQTFDYCFYFPVPGAVPFLHYPVTVSHDERAAGAAKPFLFKVVQQLSQVDKTTWDYISQYGTDAELFTFLEKNNLARLDFERVAWRVRKSADFFRKITALLAKNHLWSEPIYRYAFVHNDAPTLREWLRHRDDFIAECGPFLASKLILIDPIERRAYEHLEYSPLVNQRAHRIGAEHKIPNPIFRGQYQSLLQTLAHKPTPDAVDSMSVVYYLFLQDRVEEALARFKAIDPESLPTRLQHDYFRCYAALYEEQPAVAREIAASHANFPVERWRKLFAEVVAQADEAEGRTTRPPEQEVLTAQLATAQEKLSALQAAPAPDQTALAEATAEVQRILPPAPKPTPSGDPTIRETQQASLAGTEPSFDFKVENRTITLTSRNLREVTINYYLMDPEFLFSASPFVTQDAGRFSIIKPGRSDRQPITAAQEKLEIPLPEAFARANVLVEILGAGQRKAQPYHANSFTLNLAENYGRLEVRDQANGKPIPKAYVKVYARLKNGSVRFFKDGYTDLRGKFDYASLNSSEKIGIPPMPLPRPIDAGGATGLDYAMLAPGELGEVERLAVLILSEAHGAIVRETAAPSR